MLLLLNLGWAPTATTTRTCAGTWTTAAATTTAPARRACRPGRASTTLPAATGSMPLASRWTKRAKPCSPGPRATAGSPSAWPHRCVRAVSCAPAAACCALPRGATVWRWMRCTTPAARSSVGRRRAALWRCRCSWRHVWCSPHPPSCRPPPSACNGPPGWWPTSTSTRRCKTALAPPPHGTTCSTRTPTPAAWAMWMPATSA